MNERMNEVKETKCLGDIAVLIPSLDPDEQLVRYVIGLKQAGIQKVIVVDDGSHEDTQKYFEKFNTKTTVFKKCLYLCGFVAIPLPLTGVYTGSLIAGLSNLKLWQGFLSVTIGGLLTCIGMTIICSLFENSAFYIFVMSLIFVGAVLLVNLAIFLVNKIKNKNKK